MKGHKLKLLVQNNKGFSLIEVMIALAIFSIGILAVSSMQISAAQGNLSSRLRTEAIAFASGEIEDMMAQPFQDIVTDSRTVNTVYELEWTVTTLGNAKSIEMTVTWLDRGRLQNSTLNHIRADLD